MTAFDFSLEPSGFAMNHNGEKKNHVWYHCRISSQQTAARYSIVVGGYITIAVSVQVSLPSCMAHHNHSQLLVVHLHSL